MTRNEAVAKAQRKSARTGHAYLVTSRTGHPAYPGKTVYLIVPEADKHLWAPDETLEERIKP